MLGFEADEGVAKDNVFGQTGNRTRNPHPRPSMLSLSHRFTPREVGVKSELGSSNEIMSMLSFHLLIALYRLHVCCVL